MNIGRNWEKNNYDSKEQKYGDQYWKKYFINPPNFFCELFISLVSKDILGYNLPCIFYNKTNLQGCHFCRHPMLL